MKSHSFRAVVLTIATVTALIGSVPMVMSAADEAVEIASRTSVTANDVQVAKVTVSTAGRTGRPTISSAGRVTVSTAGRVTVSTAGRVTVSTAGRS